MAKPVKAVVKVQIEGGGAKPAPPLGPALGQHGVQIMDFCREFNAQTQQQQGELLPTVITIYEDRSFEFVVKSSPAAVLLMKAAGMEQGSSVPQLLKVAKVTWEQCREIAEKKLADLNTDDVEQGAHIIAGTARSMGYIVEGHPAGRDDQFKVCSEAEFLKMKEDHRRVPEVAPGVPAGETPEEPGQEQE
jgi:large subunit ribosomal protein L11